MLRRIKGYDHPFSILLILTACLLSASNAIAFTYGEQIYVREEGKEGDFVPATYVTERSDCLLLERLRAYSWNRPLVKPAREIKEQADKIKVGDEVSEVIKNSRADPIVYRVLGQNKLCHEVSYSASNYRMYIKPGDIYSAVDFKSFKGVRTEYSVGEKVYALQLGTSPERWSIRTVIGKRDDCYETQEGPVFCGHYLEDKYQDATSGQLFSIPLPLTKKLRKGDKVDGLTVKNDTPAGGVLYSSLSGKVKSKNKETVRIDSGSSECEYSEPIKISDILQAPQPLSGVAFNALKQGDVVLERFDPDCCCCEPFFDGRTVRSCKLSGYVLQSESEGQAVGALASQVVSVERVGVGE